ncbi:Protein F41E7.1 [Aphelenchoides avenae]|nr:Protein F41E7.1 [Aphelenchus avenae]
MDRLRPGVRNTVINIVNHRETNLLVTCIAAFVSIYIFLVAIFDRNVVRPLEVVTPVPPELSNDSTTTLTTLTIAAEVIPAYDQDYSLTVISLFLLWICAVVIGRLVNYVFLPPLLGMLLVGIAFGNIGFLRETLVINSSWNVFVRQVAFILIVIRCGLGVDPEALRQSLFVCANLGIVSTTIEALAIVLASHFIYAIPVSIAIVFAYILASTSPAVTVPTMIQLQEQGRGTEKGIPTVILASATIDNIYCITAFTIASAVIFSNADDLSYTLVLIPVQLLIGALLGIFAGLLLRSFPRPDAHLVHFTRAVLTFSVSAAFYFGTRAIKSSVAGPIAIFIFCVVASMRWKVDNHRTTRLEERGYKVIWDLLFQPLLFALIGLLFDFSLLTWPLFGMALAIMFIGIGVRIVVVFLISLCTNLNIKEQFFMSLSFFPKATAAFVPVIFSYCENDESCQPYSQIIMQTCILSIIITAPLGKLILQVLGFLALEKRVSGNARVDPFQVTPAPSSAWGSPATEPKYLFSGKDNRLHLEVNASTKQKKNGSATAKPTEPTSFEELNHQAYRIFKEQRLAEVRNEENQPKPITYEPTKF